MYHVQVAVILGKDNLEVGKIKKKVDKRTKLGDIDTVVEHIKNKKNYKATTIEHYDTYWVYVSEWNNTAYDYSILQHEIFHVADLMLRKRGFVLSDDSDEAWAYLIQDITLRVYGELW